VVKPRTVEKEGQQEYTSYSCGSSDWRNPRRRSSPIMPTSKSAYTLDTAKGENKTLNPLINDLKQQPF